MKLPGMSCLNEVNGSTNDNDIDDDIDGISNVLDGDLEDDDEIIIAQDREYSLFDEIIGCIEDIVIEQQFQDLQESFLEKHYQEFEIDAEENKLIYTEIFKDYTKTVEEFIEKELELRIENFSMKDFIKGN